MLATKEEVELKLASEPEFKELDFSTIPVAEVPESVTPPTRPPGHIQVMVPAQRMQVWQNANYVQNADIVLDAHNAYLLYRHLQDAFETGFGDHPDDDVRIVARSSPRISGVTADSITVDEATRLAEKTGLSTGTIVRFYRARTAAQCGPDRQAPTSPLDPRWG